MKLKLTKSLIALLLVSVSSLALAATIAEFAPEKEMEGTIQAVDFGANTLIFEGVRFQVLPDAEVEIRGSYGAFTMLQAGMKAVVTYRVVSESERHVTRVVQLPDNYRLEGA
jgi:hypothetical protein